MSEQMIKVSEAMKNRGFEVYTVSNAAEAKELILSLIPEGASVGAGGSVTIRELGVADELLQKGHPVYWHWLPNDDTAEVFRQAAQADFYLSSANAVTASGEIVNIDRTGNRVAALIHGPKTAIVAIGANKIVEGGMNTAIARIKTQACPPNARRLGIDTPCARTGKCDPIACGDNSLCGTITITQRPARGRRFVVVLIDQSMGY